ncbi:hypothetical protein [Phenylobacterium sp.]|uniref:hypothetical protein n=1 Tax=Phenylobacterium sp. TaxID=1871053 RepID=UPI002E36F33B|nr:hypothetical protein [Phenylobacterium sp.]HEX4712888.1 hypothetical protein [Phenylobacterium sp.]
MNDFIEKAVAAFLEDQEMKESAAYLSRGRRFETLTADQLREQWAAGYRAFATDAGRGDQEFDDLRAELRLRGLDQPLDLVQAEFAALKARITAEYEIMKAEGRTPGFEADDPVMVFLRDLIAAPEKGN